MLHENYLKMNANERPYKVVVCPDVNCKRCFTYKPLRTAKFHNKAYCICWCVAVTTPSVDVGLHPVWNAVTGVLVKADRARRAWQGDKGDSFNGFLSWEMRLFCYGYCRLCCCGWNLLKHKMMKFEGNNEMCWASHATFLSFSSGAIALHQQHPPGSDSPRPLPRPAPTQSPSSISHESTENGLSFVIKCILSDFVIENASIAFNEAG